MKYTFAIIGLCAVLSTAFFGLTSLQPISIPTVKAPTAGIKFDKMTLEKAKKIAKADGKMIFVDVYTTWCGPCKEMAKTTFTQDAVGDVFNKKFVCIKIDAENDSDGPTVASKYKVTGYPTLLFLKADGSVAKKLMGKQSADKLISVAESL